MTRAARAARALTLVALAWTLGLGAALAPPLAAIGHACSCRRPPPSVGQSLQDADVVFAGRVQTLELTKLESTFPDPRTQMVMMFESVHARFELLESWKGVVGREVDIWTGAGGGDCGFPFQQATAYLVFAGSDQKGRLGTGICSSTRPLAEAVNELTTLGPGSRALIPLPETPPFQPWSALGAVAVLAPISLGALWVLRGRRSGR